MIRLFKSPAYEQYKVQTLREVGSLDSIVWIDLQNPLPVEIQEIEQSCGITFPSKQQQEEIETSSRYLEEPNGLVRINATFLDYHSASNQLLEHEISFILTRDRLFTLRYFESKVLGESVKKLKYAPEIASSPSRILITIIETRIDMDADIIELVSKNIAQISRDISYTKKLDEASIIRVNEFQEIIMGLREALFDKQRVVSALLRNEYFLHEHHEKLRIIVKDINSLIEHTNFNFTRLEYLQNSFMGLINIEQNKIIKIFTVVSVIFMPPTLIASLYGMNFKIPELEWTFGYPFAIVLMIISSLITLLIFKRKKWL